MYTAHTAYEVHARLSVASPLIVYAPRAVVGAAGWKLLGLIQPVSALSAVGTSFPFLV